MSDQPEALRLADMLEKMPLGECDEQAAAELRRLHEQNQRFYAQHASVVSDYEKAVVALKAQRDALLEALELLVSYTESCEGLLNASPAGQVLKARAAIKAVEGEK